MNCFVTSRGVIYIDDELQWNIDWSNCPPFYEQPIPIGVYKYDNETFNVHKKWYVIALCVK